MIPSSGMQQSILRGSSRGDQKFIEAAGGAWSVVLLNWLCKADFRNAASRSVRRPSHCWLRDSTVTRSRLRRCPLPGWCAGTEVDEQLVEGGLVHRLDQMRVKASFFGSAAILVLPPPA